MPICPNCETVIEYKGGMLCNDCDFDFNFGDLDFDLEALCGEGFSSGMVAMGGDAATFDWTGDFSDLPGFGEGGLFGSFEGMLEDLDLGDLPFGAGVSAQAFTLGPDGELVELELDSDLDLDSWLEELLEEIEASCAEEADDE